MTYAIGAAGTGGHVYPGLAVAEALVAGGVAAQDIAFFGGRRLERRVYPAQGFPFVEVELQGLQRSLRLRNLVIPLVVYRAVSVMRKALRDREARVALGMGSYVTVPLGLAARRNGIPYFIQEQNAVPGFANRLMARGAEGAFVSFAGTRLPRSIEVGNPVRAELASLARDDLRPDALRRYGLEGGVRTVGVVGGSLGAGALNAAVGELARAFEELQTIQIIHLCGPDHLDRAQASARDSAIRWRPIAYEDSMQYFYAVCDLVIARGGGMVAELLVTGTPAVLVPGRFGSAGHQDANARMAEEAGAAVLLAEGELSRLPEVVGELFIDPARLQGMASSARAAAKPRAAERIAAILTERHG